MNINWICFFMGKTDFENKQEYRAGLVLIDIFTRYAVVIPIKSKTPPDVLGGTMEALQKMGKKPKMVYSDEEGSLMSSEIQEYFKKENIELHTTRGHPAFAERFIRTFEDALFKRVDADEKGGKHNIQWTDYMFEIMLTHNNKNRHSTTGMTPNEAKTDENEYEVKVNLELKAKSSRKYPTLQVGDQVKVMRKKQLLKKRDHPTG